jgi:hypothetical protein
VERGHVQRSSVWHRTWMVENKADQAFGRSKAGDMIL